jgi:acyl-CoA thioesterase II
LLTADEFVGLMDLKPAGHDRFVGHSPQTGWTRVFGGQVLAQALVAAERSVVDRLPHSLHAYFLLGGDPGEPILFEVERLRDGRSFTTRRVVAKQKDESIFVMVVSFHVAEPGFEHFAPMPTEPPPEACTDPRAMVEHLEEPVRSRVKRALDMTWPIESRPTDAARFKPGVKSEPRQSLWTRIGVGLPDDASLHRAALLYLSDMSLLATVLGAHGRSFQEGGIQVASLDHALWFHRPARADDWLLYVQDSPNAVGATGLVRGLLYSRSGALVASVAQEGLIRQRRAS